MATTVGSPINTNDFSSRIAAVETDVADLQAGWSSFTPSFFLGTNALTVGNATRTGRYREDAGNVDFYAELIYGSTSSWPADHFINMALPVAAYNGVASDRLINGSFSIIDADDAVPTHQTIGWVMVGVSNNRLVLRGTDGLPVVGSILSWAAGDKLYLVGSYEAA